MWSVNVKIDLCILGKYCGFTHCFNFNSQGSNLCTITCTNFEIGGANFAGTS